MLEAIAKAKDCFGKINGVLHAAGVPGGGMIQNKTPDDVEKILAPKVKGTLVLDSIFKDVTLDFFILTSSIASIAGGFGQVDYCSANAFLDAFAQYKNSKHGTFTVCINWDTWQVGMAVNVALTPELQKLRSENLKHAILPYEGVDAFSRILESKLSHVVVSTRDFSIRDEWEDASKVLASEVLLEPLKNTISSEIVQSRPKLSNAYVPPRNEFEQTIANIWQQLLGIEQIGIYDNFFTLGGHSLLATQLIYRVQKTFQVELPLSSFFEATTIAKLAELIEEMLIEKIEELPEEEV